MQALSKRHLGLAFVVMGALGLAAILARDVIRASERGPIGPAQLLALAGCGALTIAGLPLIRAGNRPVSGDEPAAIPAAAAAGKLAWARRVLVGIALALMIGHFAVYAVYGLSLLPFPFDYDQGEGFELNDTLLLSQGQWPYRDNAVYPFYASNYPPLYHVILIPFVWLLGPQYWYGRLAGFVATLIAAGAIGYAVHRGTRHKPIALLSGLAFLASNYVYHIGPLFRQHMTMVMFETLAVVTIAGLHADDEPRQRRRKLIVGLLLLLAAGFTKQLAIVTVAAVFVYLFLRWPRQAVAWGLTLAVIAGAVFLWINLSTAGQWWLNIITANVNTYLFNQFTGLVRQFVGLHGALLLLALVVVLYELYLDRLSIYAIWFVAATVDVLLAGKWGAGDSYFATLIAAMCILAGLFVGRCLNQQWRLEGRIGQLRLSRQILSFAPVIGLIGSGLFILYGLAVVHLPLDGPVFGPLARALNLHSNTKFADFYDSAGWTMGYATIGQIPSPTDINNGWRIVAAIRHDEDDDRPIMSEEAAFSFRTGRTVVTNPTQLLNLYQNGAFDPSGLVKMIDEQAFGAVIFRARFYPQPVLDAVDRAYKIQQTIPMNGYEYTILVPDPTWPERRAAQ